MYYMYCMCEWNCRKRGEDVAMQETEIDSSIRQLQRVTSLISQMYKILRECIQDL